MKFVIDRKKWFRGRGSQNSRLLVPATGEMCCLGFRQLATGLQPSDISDIGNPASLYRTQWSGAPGALARQKIREIDRLLVVVYKGWSNTDCVGASNVCIKITQVNDSTEIEEDSRERRLITLFAEIGDEVEFVG